MVRNRIRHLLVIDGKTNQAAGIISATDIVAHLRQNSEALKQADKDVLDALEKEGRFYF